MMEKAEVEELLRAFRDEIITEVRSVQAKVNKLGNQRVAPIDDPAAKIELDVALKGIADGVDSIKRFHMIW